MKQAQTVTAHGRSLSQKNGVLVEVLQLGSVLADFKRDWELGLWDQLAPIDYREYGSNEGAALVALVVATANQALGQQDQVRQSVKFALENGCSRQLVIQVLASGVHNILGRARLAAGRKAAATRQFHAAVEIGARSGRVSLVAAARYQQQREQLRVDSDEDTLALSRRVDSTDARELHDQCVQAFYREAPRRLVQDGAAPFILLDSKSLPRAGLHYLRNRLEDALGARFSFCEWYQEPGCCGRHPCALTGFMEYRRDKYRPAVRLIKSHDFELADPVIESQYSLRRVVLKRDPLYVLTSWFTLDQLSTHRSSLSSRSLNVEKIFLKHEPEVLSSAYQVLEEAFDPPLLEELRNWLNEKASYIVDFHDKWIGAAWRTREPFVHVVDYNHIDGFVNHFLEEIGESATAVERAAKRELATTGASFNPRRDPFESRVQAISEYLRDNKIDFVNVADKIRTKVHGKKIR